MQSANHVVTRNSVGFSVTGAGAENRCHNTRFADWMRIQNTLCNAKRALRGVLLVLGNDGLWFSKFPQRDTAVFLADRNGEAVRKAQKRGVCQSFHFSTSMAQCRVALADNLRCIGVEPHLCDCRSMAAKSNARHLEHASRAIMQKVGASATAARCSYPSSRTRIVEDRNKATAVPDRKQVIQRMRASWFASCIDGCDRSFRPDANRVP